MSSAYDLRGPVGIAMKTLGYCRFCFFEGLVVVCDELFDSFWVPFCDAWVGGKFRHELLDSVFAYHVFVEFGFLVLQFHDVRNVHYGRVILGFVVF